MSVFTPLTDAELQTLLDPLGYQVTSVAPAHHGIENTNYLLQTRNGEGAATGLVLTVLEEIDASQLPWFTELLGNLAGKALPVPAPVTEPLNVAGKPALLVPLLPGRHVVQPQPTHCQQVGEALARLHDTALPCQPVVNDATGLARLEAALELLPAGWQPAARDVLEQWQAVSLPEGLIHGDLFRDNVLFEGDRLTGLLDFYAAGTGPALYDLAVTVNDWCMQDDLPDAALEHALTEGYQATRPLPETQLEKLPLALCVAALRFWLSRLVAERRHLEEALPDTVTRKDPLEFQHRFQSRLGAL